MIKKINNASLNKSNIAFTFGGTGGHFYPCIALAQELKESSIYFIGSNNRKDSQIISKYGFKFFKISSSKKNPGLMLKAFFEARNILKKIKQKSL